MKKRRAPFDIRNIRQNIRQNIRHNLVFIGATLLGGIAFAPQAYADELSALSSVKNERRVLYENGQSHRSFEPLLSALLEIAQDQAGIWGDTILEGDFDADGQTVLDRVEGVVHGSDLIAYRITYSERAWRLNERGERGTEGRIVESSYVSKTLQSWSRDTKAFAEFY